MVNAIYVWGLTRAAAGRVLLRIEDHDRQRSRAEYERAILEDLDWLGFVPDDPPVEAFRSGPCRGRQSDRAVVYETALNALRAQGLVYACDCSRRDIASVAPPQVELRYPGTCANKGLQERPGLGLRVRLEPSVERFDDLRHGPLEQRPSEQCGDLLVRDREGNWTYQFAVTVDDYGQGVTLVIRGDDLLASTGRQIQLARLLGRAAPPRFLHHALLMETPTRKLSKAEGDTSVRDLRRLGLTPADVVGRAARAAGLVAHDCPVSARDVVDLVGGFSSRR